MQCAGRLRLAVPKTLTLLPPRRYNHHTGCITLTCERHAHREDNRRELLRQLHALIQVRPAPS